MSLIRGPGHKPWSELLAIEAIFSAAVGVLIAWKVDEASRAQRAHAALTQVWQGQSSAVLVDEYGRPIPDESASPTMHALRDQYDELARHKSEKKPS